MAKDHDQVVETFKDVLQTQFAGSNVRPMTVRLICNLLLDLPLTSVQCDDFGVDSAEHYRALRAILETEAMDGMRQRGEELDRALGNGPALTRLVQKYAPQYKSVHFETVWDKLKLRS